MRNRTTCAAALAVAGTLLVAASPSFAKSRVTHVHALAPHQATFQGYADDEQALGYFAPGFTGYGRQAYNPEQPTDPDPRIGGALKMSTDR